MLTQHELDGQLLGVFVSDNLYRGDMGYGLVITKHAITGAKKPDALGEFAGYLGPGSEMTDAARAEAEQIARKLSGAAEFKIPIGSIGQVLFKEPGMFLGGYAIIKTGLSSFRVDMRLLSIGGSNLLDTSKRLEESLWMAVGERLLKVGRPTNNP